MEYIGNRSRRDGVAVKEDRLLGRVNQVQQRDAPYQGFRASGYSGSDGCAGGSASPLPTAASSLPASRSGASRTDGNTFARVRTPGTGGGGIGCSKTSVGILLAEYEKFAASYARLEADMKRNRPGGARTVNRLRRAAHRGRDREIEWSR